MAGFGKIKPKSGNKDSLKLHEVVEMHKWPDDKWSTVRFLDTPIISVKRHWINIVAGKEKKLVTIPRYCLAHNILNEHEPRTLPNAKGKEAPVKCPYCELTHGREDTASARAEFFYLANAIIREVQEDEPRKKAPYTKEEQKTGFKDIRSKSWTPVRVCRITSSVVIRIQELTEGNMVKDKKKNTKVSYDVTDPKYGIDIRVKYKPKGAGTDKYSADADERTPLTEDEKAYLVWDLSDALIDGTGRFDVEQAKEDFKRLDVVGGDTPDDDDDDEGEGYSLGGKKGKKSKSKAAFNDDDDDEDDEPKKKKKKSKAAFDDDDDEDDDKPKKKKKSKSKSSDDDDDDDDAPKKSKKKSRFDDDDDDDDDDEDEPKPKKKKSSKSDDAPKKKKKVEEDAPKKKKKKSK